MKKHLKYILIALCMPQFILGGGCPKPADLGPRTNDDKSMCAILYEHSEDDENTSCYGRQLEVRNGEQVAVIASGWNDVASSIIVREGCTFVGYTDYNYEDYRKEFFGTHYALKHEHDYWHIKKEYKKFNWNDVISSYICQCNFNPLECTPEDNWQLILSCENNYDYDVTCKYSHSKGTTLGMVTTIGQSLSESIKKSLGLELAMKFSKASASASSSLTTGYSYSKDTEFFKYDTTGEELEIVVSPGAHVGMYQIHGRCGDTVTKTNCFHLRNMHNNEILSVSESCPDFPK